MVTMVHVQLFAKYMVIIIIVISLGLVRLFLFFSILLARDSMLSALYAIANPFVRLSVTRVDHWISRKRLKLGSCNFHHTVASL